MPDTTQVYAPGNSTRAVLREVAEERCRQEAKWGQQNHPNHMASGLHQPARYALKAEFWKSMNDSRVRELNARGVPSDRNCAWDGVLLEEVFEALGEGDDDRVRAELVQVAAVAVAWIEAIDRRDVSDSLDTRRDGAP